MSKLLIPARVKYLEENGISKDKAIAIAAEEFDCSENCVIAWCKRLPCD